MEQILLSSVFELMLHVFSLRTRHDANEGECRLLFLTGSPCCLRYFSERGNFWHTYSILWKSLKSGIHERNYKAAFPLQLMNYSWVCLWESEFTDVGLDSFWSQWSTGSLSLETICGFSVEIACNKLYFHIPKLARKKKRHWTSWLLRNGENDLLCPFNKSFLSPQNNQRQALPINHFIENDMKK